MNVFISWSLPRSKDAALALRGWIRKVIQRADPWMSENDIDKGDRWGTEVQAKLMEAQFGIVCVTPENQHRPWLNFEAGAIGKQLEGRVCPYLLGMSKGDLTGPLATFQAAVAEPADTLQLVRSINKNLPGDVLGDTELEEAFDAWWPRLKQALLAIPPPVEQPPPPRERAELLEEILEATRATTRILDALGEQQDELVREVRASRVDPPILGYSSLRDMLEAKAASSGISVKHPSPRAQELLAAVRSAGANQTGTSSQRVPESPSNETPKSPTK